MTSAQTQSDAVCAKVCSLAELVAIRTRLKAEGKRVVFTNGCFDLMHPGHVRYLREARKLGDALIVAINSDRSVSELKGPARPILREMERAEVLAALEMVDFVVVFDDLDPRATIVALLPDVLVKGGDWDLSQIIGREEVEAAGGLVTPLPFVPGVSTTEIVARILQGVQPS
ncbi:MAG: D-glycero-beta-D-manno-heptose 1-phosphate adenylyltransferase [Blastocatellia bacterium]|nr:D-glycero-beta-D-manno-heptose 1-phosphate adenylyltransferase [Blastocatellia bacterium]